MEHIAPSFTSLIKNLVLSKSGKGIVSTITQQSTVKSGVESGAESGAAENESSDEGDMEGKMATGDTERLRHYLGNAVSRNSKQQLVIMTTVLSSICYARNVRSNLVQMNMGYYSMLPRPANTPLKICIKQGSRSHINQ